MATAVNWGVAFVLTLLFPDLLDVAGNAATFGMLAVITVASIVWTWRLVPETEGRTLEEISAMFAEA